MPLAVYISYFERLVLETIYETCFHCQMTLSSLDNRLGLFLQFNTKPRISIKKRKSVNKAGYGPKKKDVKNVYTTQRNV